ESCVARKTCACQQNPWECREYELEEGELNRLRTSFACANANAIFEWEYENLAVSDASLGPGARRFNNGIHSGFHEVLIHCDLQLDLAQHVDSQLMSRIDLRMTLLPPEAEYIHDREPEHFDLVQ